jgi:hypothetical protein
VVVFGYVLAAVLEIAGIGLVFVGLKIGRDRAAEIRARGLC